MIRRKAHPALVLFLIASLLVLLALPLLAQQRFADTTDVVLVEIPIQVTDKNGEPIRGLTAENFEVYDGKKREEIVDFEVVDLYSLDPQQGTYSIPISARRHFLFLFDQANADPDSIFKARDAALDVVSNALHPTDLAAVATYSQMKGPDILLGFTSDRWQVEQAIRTLGATELDRGVDPLNLVFSDVNPEAALRDLEAAGEGGGGNALGIDMSAAAHQNQLDVARRAGQLDTQMNVSKVQTYVQRLANLGRLLDSVEGRKHVVLLSEGFQSSLLVGEQKVEDTRGAATTDMATGQWQNVDDQEMFGNTELQNDLEQMLEEFRRADAVIQAVDIGGLRGSADGRGAGGKDSLVTMARGTGGDFFQNFNKLDEAMGEMMKSTSLTYLVAFQPKKLELDGSYHRLRIKLKDAPKGARLSHRSGYYAPKPVDQLHPLEQRFNLAEVVMAGYDQGPVKASLLAAPILVPGEPAYVPVLIEVDGRSFLEGFDGDALNAEIFGYALNHEGDIVDRFSEILGLDMSKLRPAIEQSGLKFYGHLDLPPGAYSVRVLVRNSATGAFTLRAWPLEVPADASRVALLPPLVPETPGSWVMVREGEAAQQERQVAYPFMFGEQPFIPAALPRLPVRGTTPVYLVGYNLGDGVEFNGEFTDSDGNTVKGGKLTVNGQHERTPQGDRMLAELDTKGLAAGSYRLRVTAKGPAGGSASSSIPFEVVGKGGR